MGEKEHIQWKKSPYLKNYYNYPWTSSIFILIFKNAHPHPFFSIPIWILSSSEKRHKKYNLSSLYHFLISCKSPGNRLTY